MAEEFSKYTSYASVVQRQTDAGSWVDVENQPHSYAGGSDPVEAACSVLTTYVNHKILSPSVAAALKGHRVVLTASSWHGGIQSKTVIVTVEQVYEAMILKQVASHVEHRDKLPALKKALDEARAAHNQIATWVKLGPRWIRDYSELAAAAGVSPEAIAAAAKVPPRPRQPSKKTRPGVRRDQ